MANLLVERISRVTPPSQMDSPRFGIGIELVEVDRLVKATKARNDFSVSGKGLTVAVLDTGLRSTHRDFTGRVHIQRNYTTDNQGNLNDASDGNGHGTNVAGIIAADGDHIGIAPGAQILPIKVLDNNGDGNFEAVHKALAWILEIRDIFNITAVCMSLGDGGNYTDHTAFDQDDTAKLIASLRTSKIAVHVASGNDYFTHGSKEGMGFPAIIKECIGVGAVYDEIEGSFSYRGATANSTQPDQITPFSQRLHESTNSDARTSIFAPGAPVTSSGILNDSGESTQHGTSQATPVVTGVTLLLQEFHLRATGVLPEVDDLEHWIRLSGKDIFDGDDEDDNVDHTSKSFKRIDAVAALSLLRRKLESEDLSTF